MRVSGAGRRALVGVAATALVVGGLAASSAGAASAATGGSHAGDTYTGHAATAVRVSHHVPGGAASRQLARGERHTAAQLATPAVAPRASSSAAAALATTAAGSALLKNFNGVSSRDSQFTNYNLKFEPPDQGLCQGAGFVIEAVNSAYSIYRSNGTRIRGPFNINDLFNEGGKEFTSDPRCWFDPTTRTWFAVILFLNDSFTEGRLDIAVNPNPDPTGLWTIYHIDTTDLGGNGCPCFGDQPRLGIDQTNVYVTTDEFSILGPQFNGGQLYAISKADLVAGLPSIHFVHFGPLHLAGQLTGAPQPALSIGKPNAEYFLSQLDFDGKGDHRIAVFAMTGRDKVQTGGTPTLTRTIIQSEAYASPPPALQKGSTSTIDSGDDRMQQASFVNGTVWGELATAFQPAGDTKVRSAGAWFQVRPQLGNGGISAATIVRQGYVAKSGAYVIYPAVQPDAAGNAAMVFTLTGAGRFPSAAYARLASGAAAFGPPVVAAAGTGPYDKNATRWGDYSFAVPDTTTDAAWLATEYIPPISSQTTTRERNWGTRVLKVALG